MIHKYAMGIIGNGSWLALINDFGNVSWLCWPHFDSSFLFGNLLDKNNGGNFQIQPQSEIISTSQKYLNDTNILITTIETKDGRFEINDFAPIYYSPSDLIRPHIFIRKITPKQGTNLIKILAKLLIPISSRDVIGQLKFNNKVHYLKLEHGRPFNRM